MLLDEFASGALGDILAVVYAPPTQDLVLDCRQRERFVSPIPWSPHLAHLLAVPPVELLVGDDLHSVAPATLDWYDVVDDGLCELYPFQSGLLFWGVFHLANPFTFTFEYPSDCRCRYVQQLTDKVRGDA